MRLRAQLQSEKASYEQELSVAREVRDEALKKADESAAKVIHNASLAIMS